FAWVLLTQVIFYIKRQYMGKKDTRNRLQRQVKNRKEENEIEKKIKEEKIKEERVNEVNKKEDEAYAFLQNSQHQLALDTYNKILELLETYQLIGFIDDDFIVHIKLKINLCHFYLARGYYENQQYKETIEEAKKVKRFDSMI